MRPIGSIFSSLLKYLCCLLAFFLLIANVNLSISSCFLILGQEAKKKKGTKKANGNNLCNAANVWDAILRDSQASWSIGAYQTLSGSPYFCLCNLFSCFVCVRSVSLSDHVCVGRRGLWTCVQDDVGVFLNPLLPLYFIFEL